MGWLIQNKLNLRKKFRGKQARTIHNRGCRYQKNRAALHHKLSGQTLFYSNVIGPWMHVLHKSVKRGRFDAWACFGIPGRYRLRGVMGVAPAK